MLCESIDCIWYVTDIFTQHERVMEENITLNDLSIWVRTES